MRGPGPSEHATTRRYSLEDGSVGVDCVLGTQGAGGGLKCQARVWSWWGRKAALPWCASVTHSLRGVFELCVQHLLSLFLFPVLPSLPTAMLLCGRVAT